MSTQYNHVSVVKKANIYADGKCISHSLTFPDGTRKTVGVVMPSTLTFGTDAPEIIEIVAGTCRARIGQNGEWKPYQEGQRFQVPAKSSFEMEAQEPVHYVCHFGND